MTIIQGLIASINGGGASLPSFTPVDSGLSLGTDWTIEIICELNPTSFWATVWGNEVWNEGKGHLAYLGNENSLSVGAPNAADEYSLSPNFATKAYWAFTHTDAGGINVYRNGELLTPSYSGYTQPSSVAPNTLIWGSRHSNDGSGTSDPIGSGTYFWTNISSQALSAGEVATQYNNLSGPYGI